MRVFSAVLPVLLLLAAGPLAAFERCEHSQSRSLALDFTGVSSVHFVVNNHQLRIDAVATPEVGISGQACASSPELLGRLDVRQERQGDQLLVTLERLDSGRWSWFGVQYAYLTLQAGVSDDLAVEVTIGSGDAWVRGVKTLAAQVGSGDLEARDVPGAVSISVGSGDAGLERIGALRVGSVGSGDLKARDVRGAVTVGSIGSGDFELKGAEGDVEIGSIGSGAADIEQVAGNLAVGSIGSGELDAEDIGGNLSVRSKGSGSIKYRRVSGTVEVPQRR